ncbi:MAG: TrkH family potassium uptake protein [Prolixibacteraceae bacterium]|nr:TrkH family potassium uptake protein [Prolixibacteraceae bacterium]
MNISIVGRIIGKNLIIVFFSLLLSAVIAIIYSESIFPFIIPAFFALILSLSIKFSIKKSSELESIGTKEAYISVVSSWLILSLIGSVPYMISSSIPQFINAFFESVSGFTTTGSSILTDIEVLPKSILFWRSLTHWIGGIGIVLLVIVIMPTLQIGGYHLFVLESSLQDKIQPRIKAVGQRLLLIYLGLTFAEVVLLMLGKMNLFESVCHAFGTIATGGFSPKNDSIAGYSAYIQYVVMLFMFLSGTNFIVHYYVLKGKFKKVKVNEEFRFYLSVIGFIGLVISMVLIFSMHKPVEESFREAFFQVISIITCTGYATADYLQWPVFAWTLIFLSMFLGGSTGSTAGGIKMVRHLIVLKNFRKIIRKLLSPNAIILIRLNKNSINESNNHSILTFVVVYFQIFLVGSFLLILTGLDVKTSMGAVATSMAGIGPGIGTVGPVSNFAHLPVVSKAILTFLMLIGRLEIYTILALFSPSFWKK